MAAYHLRTEAEKGEAVADVDGLPDRYRAEISNPRTAFVDDVVLLALSGGTAAGCLVVTAPAELFNQQLLLIQQGGVATTG